MAMESLYSDWENGGSMVKMATIYQFQWHKLSPLDGLAKHIRKEYTDERLEVQ